MSIQLQQPYKIIQRKQKRYEEHYNIPSDKCVVVPVRAFGDDLSCDVHWKDEQGELHAMKQLFFNNQNIEPVDPLKDYLLHELWDSTYGVKT